MAALGTQSCANSWESALPGARGELRAQGWSQATELPWQMLSLLYEVAANIPQVQPCIRNVRTCDASERVTLWAAPVARSPSSSLCNGYQIVLVILVLLE